MKKNIDSSWLNLLPIDRFIDIFRINIKRIADGIGGNEHKGSISLLNDYIENATNGDLKERERFKIYLKTRLLTYIDLFEIEGLNQEKVIGNLKLEEHKELLDYILPFNTPDELSSRDKFEIMLYKYKLINKNGYDTAFNTFKTKYPCYKKRTCEDGISNEWFEYTHQDIYSIYEQENITLNYDEKADIITNRLYSDIYGLGCIDTLAYSDVNEVGINNDGEYIYCWDDVKIHLSFLKLTENQTRQIQERSIQFDKKNGDLNANNCEVLCYRKDNARITAAMPLYSSARILCIRIFNKSTETIKDIIKNDKQRQLIINLVKIGSKIVLQGELGAGKTTGMKTLLEILDDKLSIGTVEDELEQHNRLKYPNKRIIEFQSTEKKSLEDAIKSLLRASVDVASVGEARDGEGVFGFIQLSQAIANSTLVTTHVASPKDTVPRLKNMLISTGKYFTEQSAVADIVNYVNIIFQHGIINGQKCISEIVEIVPLLDREGIHNLNMDTDLETLQKMAYIQQIQQNPIYMYKLNTLMALEDGELKFKNLPSQYTINRAKKHKDTWEQMQELLKLMKKDISSQIN